MRACRVVTPYVYAYTTYAKQRWIGQTILNVFAQEFTAFSPEYYVSFIYYMISSYFNEFKQEHAILSGKLTVNHHRVTAAYTIRNGDWIVHKVCDISLR